MTRDFCVCLAHFMQYLNVSKKRKFDSDTNVTLLLIQTSKSDICTPSSIQTWLQLHALALTNGYLGVCLNAHYRSRWMVVGRYPVWGYVQSDIFVCEWGQTQGNWGYHYTVHNLIKVANINKVIDTSFWQDLIQSSPFFLSCHVISWQVHCV